MQQCLIAAWVINLAICVNVDYLFEGCTEKRYFLFCGKYLTNFYGSFLPNLTRTHNLLQLEVSNISNSSQINPLGFHHNLMGWKMKRNPRAWCQSESNRNDNLLRCYLHCVEEGEGSSRAERTEWIHPRMMWFVISDFSTFPQTGRAQPSTHTLERKVGRKCIVEVHLGWDEMRAVWRSTWLAYLGVLKGTRHTVVVGD